MVTQQSFIRGGVWWGRGWEAEGCGGEGDGKRRGVVGKGMGRGGVWWGRGWEEEGCGGEGGKWDGRGVVGKGMGRGGCGGEGDGKRRGVVGKGDKTEVYVQGVKRASLVISD